MLDVCSGTGPLGVASRTTLSFWVEKKGVVAQQPTHGLGIQHFRRQEKRWADRENGTTKLTTAFAQKLPIKPCCTGRYQLACKSMLIRTAPEPYCMNPTQPRTSEPTMEVRKGTTKSRAHCTHCCMLMFTSYFTSFAPQCALMLSRLRVWMTPRALHVPRSIRGVSSSR